MSKYSDTTEMVTPHHTRAGNNYQAGGGGRGTSVDVYYDQ